MNSLFHHRSHSGSLWSRAMALAVRGFEALLLLSAGPRRSGGGVMVVRLDAIGDFVLWLDAARNLKRLYPGRRIVLLANAVWAELAETMAYWDEIWQVDVARLKRHSTYRWRLLRAIRRRGFDVAVQPTYSRSYREGDALVRASGARERTGAIGDDRRMLPWQKRVADRWYTRLLPAGDENMTELQRNAEFMRNLGLDGFPASVPVLPKLAILPAHLRFPPYFILFPGASWSGRQWPPDRFAEIANRLGRETGLMAVLCGSAIESDLCQEIIKHSDVEMVSLAGQTSLPDLVEVVRGARLLIGNETSAVHIAAAVGTPAVCILGGGHYGRFLPYSASGGAPAGPEPVAHRMHCFGCNWQCTQGHEPGTAVPCISSVSTRDVWEASARVLRGRYDLARV